MWNLALVTGFNDRKWKMSHHRHSYTDGINFYQRTTKKQSFLQSFLLRLCENAQACVIHYHKVCLRNTNLADLLRVNYSPLNRAYVFYREIQHLQNNWNFFVPELCPSKCDLCVLCLQIVLEMHWNVVTMCSLVCLVWCCFVTLTEIGPI